MYEDIVATQEIATVGAVGGFSEARQEALYSHCCMWPSTPYHLARWAYWLACEVEREAGGGGMLAR